MTSTVIHNGPGHPFPGGVKDMTISCDADGCEVIFSHDEIAAKGGLKQMGWQTEFDEGERVMKHYCPEHNTTIQREGREL